MPGSSLTRLLGPLVPPKPVITAQPSDATVSEPATAGFSVTATGATSYQWQVLAGGGPSVPILLGTETLTLSTSSTTPGAQSITVPTGTLGVVVMARTNTLGMTLASTFAGTWTAVPPPTNYQWLQYAPVTATGAQTITPEWTGYIAEGPVFQLFYIGSIDNSSAAAWVRDAQAGEVDTLDLASTVNDLVIALDTCFSSGGAVPGAASGWTTQGTPYANGGVGARGRTADAPGASITTVTRVTASGTTFHGLSAISIIGSASASWEDVSSGSGGTTSSYTTGATTVAMDGYQYRCVITGPGGVTISSAATLTVNAGGGGSTVTAVSSLAMAVQLARTAALGADIAVQAPQQAGTAVDMAVRTTQSASASLAAAIQQAQAASSLVQLAVQAPQSNSASVAAAVQVARIAAASLDLVIQQAQALGVGVDLQVQTPSAASAAVSLQIQVGSSLSTALAIAVQELRQASAAVALAVSQARTVATDASLAVQVSRSAGVSSTMAVRQARTSAASVDLQIQDGATRATSLQAAVQFAADASVAVGMAVADLRAAGVGLSMAISLQRVLGAVVDLYVREASLAAFGLAIFILDEGFDSESDTVRYQRIARAIERGQAQGSASSVFLKIGKRSRYRGM